MKWLFLLIGLMTGGLIGVVTMCLMFVSGTQSREEENDAER